jgi:hypothetical protein
VLASSASATTCQLPDTRHQLSYSAPLCPQTPGGEVVINGEVQPRDTLKLRLYSTSNNVKSTGQGNFWLTGVQPLIKMHQDVKVISVEMTPARELRIVLTSQGLWHK